MCPVLVFKAWLLFSWLWFAFLRVARHQKVQAALMFRGLFSFTDNELLYRGRDGDVVRFTVDTQHRSVIVPNQWFVSTASPMAIACGRCVVTARLCLIPSRKDAEPLSTRCRRTWSTCCLRSKWDRWAASPPPPPLAVFSRSSALQLWSVCLFRCTSTPLLPSTLFTALRRSKNLLCWVWSFSFYVLSDFRPRWLN